MSETKNLLKYKDSRSLSLLDFANLLTFIAEILEKWNHEIKTHIKIGKEGMQLPRDVVHNTKSLIESIGGFKDLDYIALSRLHEFFIIADFKKGEFKVKCKNKELLKNIMSIWDKHQTAKKEISTDLRRIAILSEGKRFIFSCLGEDGNLKEDPKGKTRLDNVYVTLSIQNFNLKKILLRFADFLIENENADGGWGPEIGSNSDVVSTANVLLVLFAAKQKEVAKNGISFLISKQETNGSWSSDSTQLFSTAIATLALHQYSSNEEFLAKSISFLESQIKEEKAELKDYLILTCLKQKKIIDDEAFRSVLDTLAKQIDINTILSRQSIVEVLLSLNVLLDRGDTPNQSMMKRVLEFLVNSRNTDGGWPLVVNEKSKLYPTILALDFFYRKG